MSDSLRDRIAAVVLNALGQPYVDSAESLIVADAVIAELGGRYEYAVATDDMQFVCMYVDERSELDGVNLHPGEKIVRRWVTDWEAE